MWEGDLAFPCLDSSRCLPYCCALAIIDATFFFNRRSEVKGHCYYLLDNLSLRSHPRSFGLRFVLDLLLDLQACLLVEELNGQHYSNHVLQDSDIEIMQKPKINQILAIIKEQKK